MKIASDPVRIAAPVVRKVEERLPPGAGTASVAEIPGLPFTRPLVRVPLRVGGLPAAGVNEDSKVAVYRFVSKLVAEHLGTVAKVVTGAVWLAVDVKTLRDHFNDPSVAPGERLGHLVKVAGSVVGTLSAIPALEALDKVEVPIHFLADLGDSFRYGQVTLSGLDLASYAGGDAAKVAEATRLLMDLAPGA